VPQRPFEGGVARLSWETEVGVATWRWVAVKHLAFGSGLFRHATMRGLG
jgi:hypothetical protein